MNESILLELPVLVNVIDLNCLGFNYRIDRQIISMYYHRLVCILLNRRVHSVIDDITGQVVRAGNPEAAPPAEETNQVPPGRLIEWT